MRLLWQTLCYLDTNVIIDYLRGRPEAGQYMNTLGAAEVLISAITVAELYGGVREGAERTQLDTFISQFEIVPIETEIARKAGLYRRDYGKSHSTETADALIAATAELRQATLITLNKKHFPMLTNVIVPYQRA